MTAYLSYRFNDNADFISTFDEAPLWSAAFGLMLLKHLELKPNLTVLDLGSGAGFPLMELAARLGNSCKLFGVEPWINANARARQKIKNYGLSNVEILECSAAQIPLANDSVDLVVSNLGINNFENPELVFKESNRVLKAGGRLALTTNLNGHWKEFYEVFAETLLQLNKPGIVAKLNAQQEHRGTVASISKLFTDNGFKIKQTIGDSFEMKFLDGSAFLNHYFVKLGWLSSWIDLIPEEESEQVFNRLESNLNSLAQASGALRLTIPMAYIEGEKQG